MFKALFILSLVPAFAGAQARATEETLSPELDARLARGLAYLARQQRPDGSFQNLEGGDPKSPRFGGAKVPLTGLSLMAFLATGRMPDAGRHGQVVRGAIDYLVKACPPDGYYGKIDGGGQMTGHAVATLALAEAYGMESDPVLRRRVRAALARAVRVILVAQNVKKDEAFRGGWRNDPTSPDGDLYVTGWCVLALRAALNAGMEVPKASADRAAEFVLRCWRADKGAFANQPGGDATITATAIGLLDLQLLDRATRPEIVPATKFLVDNPVSSDTEFHYFARHATTHAAYHLGGPTWTAAWDRNASKLLGYQQKDGSWPQSKSAKEPGQTYATAINVLTLAIPLRLLPTYQR
jgi:hypothetical protein